MDQDVERGRPVGAIPRHERTASLDEQRRAFWIRRLSEGSSTSVVAEVTRLVSAIARGPFGPVRITSYRFPGGRHEIHLEIGPERESRLAGVGQDPVDAAAALLVLVEQEMAGGRLEPWRARTSR